MKKPFSKPIDSENLYIIDKYKVKEKPSLNTSLTVASTVNAYSLGVQYVREWFLSKFPSDYFKSINIEGRHTFYDFRKLSKKEMLKRLKPALSISPQLQFDFNRENIDAYPYGSNLYVKNFNYEDSFFKDYDNNLFLGLVSELMAIDFEFKIKVSTRSQQIDLYKYMQLNMRIGFTQGENIALDYHVPYGTMLQIAEDAGFEIENERVKDITGFVNYLNRHSFTPFLYKLRTINGNDEFFLRFNDVYAWISTMDPLTQDDGDKEGMVNTSYVIEMRCQLRIPAPKFYVYSSNTKHITIERRNKIEDVFGVYDIQNYDVPPTNSKGWNQIITTEYFEDTKGEPLAIDFNDFFKDTELGEIISYNNDIAISSSICIDFIIHNNGIDIEWEMDWENLILRSRYPLTNDITYISIYADTEYINKIILNRSNAINK